MAGKLLILSFHGAERPGVKRSLLGEDLRFKKAAIDSGLIAGDAMDEPAAQAALDPSLFEDPKAGPASGLERGTFDGTQLMGLNKVGINAWARPPFGRRPSLFEKWLTQVFATPAEVLVLAGHHHNSLVWGSEDTRTGGHRWYSALRPVITQGRSKLEIRGHKLRPEEKDEDLLRAGPFDLTETLRPCRLLVILGCNGSTTLAAGLRSWVANAAGRPPFILGWYGIHSFPVDQVGEHFSSDFWDRLKTIAPGSGLSFLHDPGRAQAVVEAWAGAMKTAFENSKTQRHLLFAGKRDRGPRGAGAIDPSGGLWAVVDAQGTVEKLAQMPAGGSQ